MAVARVTRRVFMEGGLALSILNLMPFNKFSQALAQGSMEDRVIAAAKSAGNAQDVTGIIWAPYLKPMQPPIEEFQKATGIGIGSIKDLSTPTRRRRAMAEALTRSPDFDIIHVGSEMIPSLVSAGYLEPLDEYMKKANYKMDAVGDYANLPTYDGKTYGIITDGNIFVHQMRKDMIEDADNKKRFEDKFGKQLDIPRDLGRRIPADEVLPSTRTKDIYGSGNLRSRGFGYDLVVHDVSLRLGGFPFDADMKPTVDSDAGQKAIEIYLQRQGGRLPGIAELGHVADDSPHRGRRRLQLPVLGRPDQDRTKIRRNRRPPASGFTASCRAAKPMASRCIAPPSMPVVVLTVNRNSPRKARRRLPGVLARHRRRRAPRSCPTGSTPSMTPGPRQEMTDPAGAEGLSPGGGQGDQGKPRGGGATDLSDRQPGVSSTCSTRTWARAYRRPAQAERSAEADRRGIRQGRQADRHRQAEEGLRRPTRRIMPKATKPV